MLLFVNNCHALLQEVPEKTKESPGEPWEFVGLLPLLDPPRSDSADTIKHALNLGVNVKMITGTILCWGQCEDDYWYNPMFPHLSTILRYISEKLFKLKLL